MRQQPLYLPDGFPQPDVDALSISKALLERIRESIRQSDGVIPFDRFMEMALYEPGMGYYNNGSRKFGSDGDFVTAPEISPLFGRCVARSIATVLESIDGGQLLELGAGSGVLAVDVLRELESLDCLPEAYLILDRSGELRERQQQRFKRDIPHLLSRISWLDALPENRIQGVIFGNEVADALPVKRFRWTGSETVELGVGADKDNLCIARLPVCDEPLAEQIGCIAQNHDWKPGYESEWCASLESWASSLSDCLDCGMLMLVDYGYSRAEYYHPQRTHGTLMCHYRHRAHADPLLLPGLQDITAYVDFTSLADSIEATGMALAGYCTQAHFLLDSGLEQMLAELDASDQKLFFKRVSEVKTLTLPGEMGERFKVLAFGRDMPETPAGFGMKDLRSRL